MWALRLLCGGAANTMWTIGPAVAERERERERQEGEEEEDGEEGEEAEEEGADVAGSLPHLPEEEIRRLRAQFSLPHGTFRCLLCSTAEGSAGVIVIVKIR